MVGGPQGPQGLKGLHGAIGDLPVPAGYPPLPEPPSSSGSRCELRVNLHGHLYRRFRATAYLRGFTLAAATDLAVRAWLAQNESPAAQSAQASDTWALVFRDPKAWRIAIYHCVPNAVELREAAKGAPVGMYQCPHCQAHVSVGALRLEPQQG